MMRWQAKWLWYPEGNSEPNTFVLFRHELILKPGFRKVSIQLSAETRYLLFINGKEICSGPPPYDPRWQYYDQLDISDYLKPGKNILGARVWFFGQSDGGAVAGAPPGFCLQGTVAYPGKKKDVFFTEKDNWTCHLLQAYRSGTRRWALRSLNEEFDARLFPVNWLKKTFRNRSFVTPVTSEVPPGRPMFFIKAFGDLGYDYYPKGHDDWQLTYHDTPFIDETPEVPAKIIGKGTVVFNVPPEDYYNRGLYDHLKISPMKTVREKPLFPFTFKAKNTHANYVIFDFGKLRVGRIRLNLTAPEGTVIEISFDERRRDKELLSPTPRLKSWARYICRQGRQQWTTVDFESFRYLQITVRNSIEKVVLNSVEVLHRHYPIKPKGSFSCSDQQINSLWNITGHTIEHTCHEQIVDNNHRERQQYAGDIDWAKLALYYMWGDYTLARKQLLQFGQGQMRSGQFMPCWPTGCRLESLGEYQLGVRHAAFELVDHSLNYILAVWRHYQFTGDKCILEQIYPKLRKFHQQLRKNLDTHGMIDQDVYKEGLIFIDHVGWGNYRDNMAACAMLHLWALNALHEIALVLMLKNDADEIEKESEKLRRNIIRRFYNRKLESFVNNPEEVNNGQYPRRHEAMLALAIINELAPLHIQNKMFDLIENYPVSPNDVNEKRIDKNGIGRGTPVSAIYTYQAAGKLRRVDFILKQFREKWMSMPSVTECSTISEDWEWHSFREASCQNLPVPGFIIPEVILGIKPLSPGFSKFSVDPQIGNLRFAKGTVPTPHGNINIRIDNGQNGLSIKLKKPSQLTSIIPKHIPHDSITIEST